MKKRFEMKVTILFCTFLIISQMTQGNSFSEMSSSALDKKDPNKLRSTRLLYSPRSPPSRANIDNMQAALKKLRENQLASEAKRSDRMITMVPNVNQSLPTVNNNHATDDRLMKEMCHMKALHKCGAAVIEGFALSNLMQEEKCRIRQDFLHCLIKLKRRPCRTQQAQEFSVDSAKHFRQQILQLLWSARGCVLGVEIPN